MNPEEFLKELSKYEIDVRRHRPRKRDLITLFLAVASFALGVFLIFRSGGSDFDVIGGGLLIAGALLGAARSQSGIDIVAYEGPGGDPNDKGSDTTTIIIKPRDEEEKRKDP